MNINGIYALIMVIMSGLISIPTFSQTPFQKNGKWGLEDTYGKVILKAKYDSIAPFNDDYAVIMSKGNKGLVNRDGKVYLPCKYKEILFPVYLNHEGQDFFWTSTDGQVFYAVSKKTYVNKPFGSVFFGPDKKWYGFNQKWQEICNPVSPKVKDWNPNKSPIKKLGKEYSLFDGKLYNEQGREILKNVGSCKRTKIDDVDFYFIKSKEGEEFALLNSTNGNIWKKDRNSIWSCGLDKMMLKNNQLCKVKTLNNQWDIFTVKHPEFDRYSLYVKNSEVIPYKLTNAEILTHYRRDHVLFEFSLECKSGLYSSDLDDLIAALKSKNEDIIISIKSGLGTSIFDKDGTEIIHHQNADKIFCKNGLLMASIDGTDEIIEPGFDKNLLKYDAIDDTQASDRYPADVLVMKDGKWGLYIKGSGELVPPLYDHLHRGANLIFVYKDDKQGLYTNEGRKITDPVYQRIEMERVYGQNSHFYIAKKSSGETYILGDQGQILTSLGDIDRVDVVKDWGTIHKNGKMGVINLRTFKVVAPCQYENNMWPGENGKFGVYRRASGGDIVDIYHMSGKKLASRFCPSGTLYKTKRWLESQLNISLQYGW